MRWSTFRLRCLPPWQASPSPRCLPTMAGTGKFLPASASRWPTPLGIMVAMAFTSIPFVVRTVQPVLEELSAADEEAAVSLGASDARVFRKVLFPSLWPALVTGVALSFARSLGEFGAVIFIAGNSPYVSEVTSLMIFVRLQEYDYAAASAIASVVLLVSLVLLFAINLWQGRYLRRLEGR